MLAGPVRMVIEYSKSAAIKSTGVGEYFDKGFDMAANALTAAAHNTEISTIKDWANSNKPEELKNSDIPNKEESIKFANEIYQNKQGAEYLINIAAGVIGVGVGKGVAKGKDSELDISKSGVELDSSKKQTLEVGWVDEYGTQKKITGDGTVARDHQPSKAALLKRAEEIKGAPLTQAEKTRIINEATSVTVPKEVHMAGPTNAGKNTKELIEKDANDLQAAQLRDSNAMIENAKVLTPEYVKKLEEACTTISCKTNVDYDKFLKNIMDQEAKKNDK